MNRLTIGDWLLNPAMNQISRAGEVQHLEPKAVEVLVALARHAGEVVSRDNLLSEIWKGVSVSDDVLTQSITKLRQALGDTSREPSYIQTIPKRGYRLIAKVAPHIAGTLAGSGTVSKSRAAPGRWPYAIWILGAAAIVAALGASWLFGRGVSLRVPTLAELSPRVTNSPDLEALPEVVVRHFSEVEGDQLQALLARGFTARLITDLSRLPDIRVVSRRDGSAPADTEPTRKAAGGSYVVGGEIQRNGDNVRVYIHLGEAVSGRSLWSEQYDRPYTDLFGLQDDLVQQVLAILRNKVTHAELARHARPYTRNLEAYEHFLRGQSALIVRRKEENEAARQSYLKAIQLDPTFARAYAGLALTYAADRRNRWAADGDAALAKAFELTRMAQGIDADAAEIYFVLAYVDMERGVFPDAVGALRTALRISPSYADAYALLGAIHTYRGEPGETIPLIRTAMRLVPDTGHLYYLILGRAYFFLGDAPSALLYLRQGAARNPEDLEIRIFLAAALVLAGQRDDAVWEAGEIRSLEPAFSVREWLKSYPLSDAKSIKQLTDAVGSLGL
jgi:DNA-binding winged helix-turn-helix (wHTH) protein/TolB-like protein/cytochrome c-type biogenesis protein CcmH/NrfG